MPNFDHTENVPMHSTGQEKLETENFTS